MPARVSNGLVVAMVLAAVGAARADEAAIAEGHKIAVDACSPCHAIGTDGESPKAEAPRFRELGRKYPIESLEEALAEGVVVGHPGMPQVKMTEHEIAVFLAYLKSVQRP